MKRAMLSLGLALALVQTRAYADVDGAHAMDFDFGLWRTHSSRLMHPLTGSTEWKEMDGFTDVKPVWNGRANIAEFKGDGPAGHVELLALRTFDPTTAQWYLNFSHPNSGTLGVPGVGVAKNGRIDFYDQETLDGRAIWVRFSIWGITPDSAQSEQAFSADAGKTWEVNWVNRYSRVKETGTASESNSLTKVDIEEPKHANHR